MTDGANFRERLQFNHRKLLIVFVLVFTFSLLFSFYTRQAWEDWYITYRVSKNLAMGHGPVFTIGERVHAFTSPLGMLIPAFFGYITNNRSDELVLWLFRVLSCSLLGLSAVVLLKTARAWGMSFLAAAAVAALFAINDKIIAFSINGMETAFMMFFLTYAVYLLSAPAKGFIVKLGLVFAGLMWTRPDSFVYIGGLTLGWLLFNPPSPHFRSRAEAAKKFALVCMVSSVLYLPWILWAGFYYGTPIPHTIIAKGLFMDGPDLGLIKQLAIFLLPSGMDMSVMQTFTPQCYWLGGWPDLLIYPGVVLAVIAARYWWLPFGNPVGRAVSFALFLAHFYLTRFPASVDRLMPWYITSVALLSIIVLGLLTQDAVNLIVRLSERGQNRMSRAAGYLLYCCVGISIAGSLFLTVANAYQRRQEQEIIEDGHRKKIGLWLKENAASTKDRVFIECLGYVGFYSQLKMLDFPGLSSPEVVEARRRLRTDDYAPLIQDLQPDWLVLRPGEIADIQGQIPYLLPMNYVPGKVFDATAKLDAAPFEAVRRYLRFHQKFTVFRRNRDKVSNTEEAAPGLR